MCIRCCCNGLRWNENKVYLRIVTDISATRARTNRMEEEYLNLLALPKDVIGLIFNMLEVDELR